MRNLISSAKPGSSVVLDKRNGVKYHVHNREVVVWENRETGETKTAIIGKFITSREYEVDVIDLAKRRYRRVIRIFRETIDSVLSSVYTTIPVYRDCYVSDIVMLIRSQKGIKIEDLALSIFAFIETKNNGK